MEVPPTSGMPWLQPRRVMWRRPGWIGIEAWEGGGFRCDQKPVIQTKRLWPCCLGWIYVLVCICIYIYMIAGSLNHQHHKTWNSHVVVCRAVVTWNSNWVLLHVFAQGAAEGAQRFHSALLGQAVAIPGNHRKPAICWKPWGLNWIHWDYLLIVRDCCGKTSWNNLK